jgi:hypothetical protein
LILSSFSLLSIAVAEDRIVILPITFIVKLKKSKGKKIHGSRTGMQDIILRPGHANWKNPEGK